MSLDLSSREFRPELLSRRGEFIAWGLALVVLAAWAVERVAGIHILPLVPALAIFLLLAALAISLGNWMDRQSVIRLDGQGIDFTNGLRHTHLAWDEIREVQVFPSTWGKKVRVVGPDRQFAFRTLGEVKVGGEIKGRMGFASGELILKRIVEKAGLQRSEEETGSGYYYLRR